MIPKIFHLTARSKQLTWEENKLMGRLRRLHPDWDIRLWDDNDNRSMVQQYYPHWLTRFDAIAKGVAKADIARYMYMAQFGGVYIDTDYKVLRRFEFPIAASCCALPISRGTQSDSLGSGFRLGNAILFSHPGHPFWTALLNAIFNNLDSAVVVESTVEDTTGPEALTRVYLHSFMLDKTVVLPERYKFHPRLPLGGFAYQDSPQTFGAHLCWASWRRQPFHVALRNIVRRKVTAIT